MTKFWHMVVGLFIVVTAPIWFTLAFLMFSMDWLADTGKGFLRGFDEWRNGRQP